MGKDVRGWDLPRARTLTPQTAEAVPLRPISELALCIPRGTYSKPKESESEDSAPPLKVYTLSSLRSGGPEVHWRSSAPCKFRR